MRISAEEAIMYDVMKAIYESGIPICFKGSMVLKAYLFEAGYPKDVRQTVDIDANWTSGTVPSAEEIVDSLQKAICSKNIDYKVKLYRMYGDGRSAGLEVIDNKTERLLFTMDVSVGRPKIPTKIYQIETIRFQGATPTQMLVDKLSVLSSAKVFRRIKDVIDIYYLSKVFDYDSQEVAYAIERSGRVIDSFNEFLHKKEQLRFAYDKFRFEGNIYKIPFDEIYDTVLSYIEPFLPNALNNR